MNPDILIENIENSLCGPGTFTALNQLHIPKLECLTGSVP